MYGIYYEIFIAIDDEMSERVIMTLFWFILLLVIYGVVTWLIASDDDSQNSYYIKEIKEQLEKRSNNQPKG